MSVTLSEQFTRQKPMAAKKGPHDGPDLNRGFGTFQLTMFGVGARPRTQRVLRDDEHRRRGLGSDQVESTPAHQGDAVVGRLGAGR